MEIFKNENPEIYAFRGTERSEWAQGLKKS